MKIIRPFPAIRTLLISFGLILLTACAEDIPQSVQNLNTTPTSDNLSLQQTPKTSDFSVESASWSATDSSLIVNGVSANSSERISISNASNGEALASTVASRDFIWSVQIQNPDNIPCGIIITSESGIFQKAVANAPSSCDTQNNFSRAVAPENPVVYPDAIIVEPMTDLSIKANDVVNFQAGAKNTQGDVAYKWQFSGVVPNSSIQNPGEVRFKQPGIYRIALTATDSRGLSDPSPPMRLITVSAEDINTLVAPPIANIDTPVGDQTIMMGDTLNFTGSGSDPGSTEPLSFLWNFDGAAPNSTEQNPGDITFQMAGIFTIVLSVSDAMGNVGTAQITVTVGDATQTNNPPVGMITSPVEDLIINPGDSILVEGSAVDPDGDTQIDFFWEFDGVISDVNTQSPGMVTYANEGVYTIRLTAVDSLGLPDPNPPVRTITVQASAPISNDLPNGEILMPAMDTTINAGESIIFTATGTAAPGNEPIKYLWSFDGVAPNVATKDTGAILFPDVGVYSVTLIVIDALNQIDPTPAIRVITVVEPSSTPPTPVTMVSHIISPDQDVSIMPGEAVTFSGSVEPEANPPYSYLWLFDGAAPNSDELSPGEMVFTNPDVYSVMFFAIDKDGMFDSQPAIRTITVQEPPAVNPNSPPIATIVEPASDLMITAGDTVTFVGSAVDTSGNNMLSYLWTFDGAAPSSTLLSPDPITFDTAGNYQVVFIVIDSSDPANLQTSSEAIVNIMVEPNTNANPTPTPQDPVGGMPMMPDGIIVSPAGDMAISVGSTIEFIGDGVNPIDSDPLNYVWDFGNGTVSTSQRPGNVTFNQVGVFTVTLSVNHDEKEFDPTPAVVVITVEAVEANGSGG